MNRKFITSSLILLSTVFMTYLLAGQPVLLLFLIIATAYIKHRIYPIKKEFVWFLLISIGGGVTEVLLVNSGSVWNYSISQILNIPIWIPFFWGVLATTIIVMYEGLVKK